MRNVISYINQRENCKIKMYFSVLKKYFGNFYAYCNLKLNKFTGKDVN